MSSLLWKTDLDEAATHLRSSQIPDVGVNLGFHLFPLASEYSHLSSMLNIINKSAPSATRGDLQRVVRPLVEILENYQHFLPAQTREALLILSSTKFLEDNLTDSADPTFYPSFTSKTFPRLNLPEAYLLGKYDQLVRFAQNHSQTPAL